MPKLINEALNRFQTYGSASEYFEKTGRPCPPFDPTQPEKLWEDLEGANSTEEMVVYPRVPIGLTAEGPVYKTKFLTPEQAGRVNIRPAGYTTSGGKSQEFIPCPHRELRDDEVVLRKKDAPAGITVFEVWTSAELQAQPKSDHDLLVAIAKKVGVEGV